MNITLTRLSFLAGLSSKSLFTWLCLLLALSNVQAQKTDTVYTAQGKLYQIITKDGNTKHVQTYTYSGRLESEAYFKNGKKHGLQKEYTSYGKPKIEANYQEGLLSGSFKKYFPKGELWQYMHYKIFNIDGQKQSLVHGEAKYYHQNGYLSREGNYKKGKEDGKWKYYDQNGQLSEEKVFEDGKMAGMFITYYPNGQIQSEAEVYEGVTIDNVYFEKLVKGWNKRYFDNGQPDQFTEIENGKPTGNEKRWHKEGGLRYEAELVDENQRVSKYYTEKGELGLYLEEKKTLKDSYVRWVKHGEERNYKDGNLSAVTHYIDGERHGKFMQYDAHGIILASGELHRGKSVGVSKSYYENGQLKSLQQKDFIIYWQGDTGIVDNGWQKRYTENGQLTFEALKDMGEEVYQASYSEQGDLISRAYDIHKLKWIQEYYPKGELKTDQINNFYHSQKGVWFINGVQQEVVIKSYFKYEDTYEIKRDGMGAILSAKKNGEPYIPDSTEVRNMLFSQNNSFYQNQLFNGDITLNYKSGQKRLSFTLKDSLPDGVVRLYRPDGSLAFYGEVEEGLSRGISYFLSSEGDTMLWQRKGFQKKLERKSWSTDSSFTEEKYNERGVRLYTYETHPGGAPELLVDEENNIHKRWQPDGQLSSEAYPVEGFQNRMVHIDYYPNGQMRSKYYYENKQRVGVFVFYHENGQLNTRSYYVNGKQEGQYESYFEDGSLRSKGEMIDDKKEGFWKVSREGKIEDEYYKDDKLQIKPPAEHCACVDTALASGHFGFLNLLKYQLEYRKYKNLHFTFLQPLDSVTYHSLFYRSAYGSSIDLISYQPLTFKFDKEGDNILTINACHTKGYISSLHFLFWQHRGHESLRLILENARLRYVFKNRFFEQVQKNKRISLLIENERAEFNHINHIELEDNYVEPCFEPITSGSWQLTSANIRLLPNVLPEKTRSWFQYESFDLMKLNNLPESFTRDSLVAARGRADSITIKVLSPSVRKQALNGFVAKSGAGSFQLNDNQVTFALRYMWLTNNWATGVFDVEVSTAEENGNFTIQTSSGEIIESSLAKLEQQLKKDGLVNLKVERYPNQNKVRVEFFNL